MKVKFNTDKGYILQDVFNSLLPESLSMNQYELAEMSEYSAEDWSEFLHDGAVQKAIESENALIAQANMRKLIGGAADNDRSVGAAQMINAMAKVDNGDKAEEHFYIYSHVPLTENETHATYVREEQDWRPPSVIQEEVVTEDDKKLAEFVAEPMPEAQPVKESKKEVDEDEWF